MTKRINVEVQIEIEEKYRAQFQKDGHMLFALYGPGDTPNDPPIRRQWNGDKVFIATLRGAALNDQFLVEPSQTLRVMSDSQERVEASMRESVLNTLFANARAAAIQGFDYQQFLALNDQRNRLAQFIEVNYAWEIANGKHERFATIFDVAVFYLRKERRRWLVRLASLFQKKTIPNQKIDEGGFSQ